MNTGVSTRTAAARAADARAAAAARAAGPSIPATQIPAIQIPATRATTEVAPPIAPVTAVVVAAPPAAEPVTRRRAIEVVRVCFGVIWLIDAGMKWSPTFTSTFLSDVSGEKAGQPGVVKAWLGWWVSLLGHQPHAWAHVVAVSETALGLCLVLGAFTNLACAGGAVLSLLIWSTAEGLGGPYAAGSTDVGTSLVYAVVFAALLAAGAGGWASADRWLRPRFGRLCARSVPDLPAPPRWAITGFALLAAAGLTTGLLIALVDAPMQAGAGM